jgi:DNA-binding Xre family transcriptional regulator
MWRDKLLHEIEKSGYSTKQLAEKSDVSENTIKRIKKYPNVTIQLITLEQLVKALNLTLQDITSDTNMIVGSVKLEVLQDELNKLKSDYDILLADKNLLESENKSLLGRIELVEMKLMYTEKLLSVYEKFDKIK